MKPPVVGDDCCSNGVCILSALKASQHETEDTNELLKKCIGSFSLCHRFIASKKELISHC